MFTGIIEEIGKIDKIEKHGDTLELTISAPKICKDSKQGDSISIDGVCLSVTALKKDRFKVQAVRETLERTTLLDIKENSPVNLERAMRPTDRLGGHILTGHIDGIGKISTKSSGETFNLTIEAPLPLMKYIVPNGSIAIDGISLTVKEVEKSSFKITIIPYTTSFTTIGTKKINDKVNIEIDILTRYVEKAIAGKRETITQEFLKEKGFL
ncbi:MAG: riboflavin synthase [Candidatus Ratteibacteria bacterium]|nr:riboflavin synthase [Candidatus Ratteibacteria bacterium]